MPRDSSLLTRKGLPGEPEDEHSRYIEAIVNGIVIGGLYLPNGNPYPGPKFDYKLRWFKRLHDYAAELLELEVPVALAGDYNVMPTEIDVYKPERWTNDALFRVEVREAYRNLVNQGWTDALRHLHPNERIADLATVVDMSRGQFISTFTQIVGQSPIAYLNAWRLALGRAELHAGANSSREFASVATGQLD